MREFWDFTMTKIGQKPEAPSNEKQIQVSERPTRPITLGILNNIL